MKQMKKTLCLLLALVMLLSLGPVPAFAEGETSVCTEHVYGEDGLCTICGAEKPADPPACTEHVYGEDGLCMVCGAEKPADPPACTEHVYGEDGLCTVCGAEKPAETSVCTEHVYGEDGLCTVCGAEKPADPPACTEHVYGEDGLCTVCGAEKPAETSVCTEHVYGEDGLCTVCGAEKPADPPACTEHVYGEDGLCTVCGAEKPADRPACTEHVYGEDGLCTVCGAEKPAETVTETVPEVDYPMQSFNFRADAGTEITVDAPEGAFPEGTKMTVSEEQDLTELQALIDADEELEGVIVAAADISFYYHDEKIQPRVPVYVSYASAAAAEAEEPKLIHIGDDNRIDVMDEVTAETVEASSQAMQAMSGFGTTAETPASTEMLKLSFRAGSFSRYAILNTDAKAPAAPEASMGEIDTDPARDGKTAANGTISISGDWPAASDTSYVMEETQNKGFALNYSILEPTNIVLVVDCLAYGADFASIPTAGDNIREVVKLSQGRIALRMANSGGQLDYTATFAMNHVALTNDQVLELIDSDTIPTTRIAVAEYTLDPDTPLADVLTAGQKVQENVLWEGTPYFNPAATVIATEAAAGYTHTYKVTVPAVTRAGASLTDAFLYRYGDLTSNSGVTCNGFSNGEPRFRLPAAYNDGGALMEIVSVRFYEPSPLVRLVNIHNTETRNGLRGSGRDLDGSDFTGQWGDWIIGERTYDAEKDAWYYEITPPSRFFNANTKGRSDYFGGMVLRWQLADQNVGFEPSSSYLAENTLIRFRLPGDGETVRTAEVRGPEIITGALSERDVTRTFPAQRAANRIPQSDLNVIVGSIHHDELFTSIFNGEYGTVNQIYVPAYNGPITQTYDFPYQIEPLKISLYDYLRCALNEAALRSELSGISYTTWDDNETWIPVDQSVIDGMNAVLNDSRGWWESFQQPLVSAGSFEFPAGVQVRQVRVQWARLGVTERWHHNSYSAQIRFDYRVNNWTDQTRTARLPQYTQVQVKYRESYDGTYNGGQEYKPGNVNASMFLPGQSSSSTQSVEAYLWFRLKDQLCPDLYGTGVNGTGGTAYYINDGQTATVGHLGFSVGQYGERYDYIHDPEITLKLLNPVANGDSALANISEDQMIAFLSGEFTAMPRLSGWTFSYTAKNSAQQEYTNTVTIPAITDPDGVFDNWLPLPEGYAFTSVKLSYNGDADLSHESEADTNTVIWLMRDIKIRRSSDIPWLPNPVYVSQDYKSAEIRLSGAVTFTIPELDPHCSCAEDTHAQGQTLLHKTGSGDIRGVFVYSTRQVKMTLAGALPQNTTIYQGDGVGDEASESAAITWNGDNYYGIVDAVSTHNVFALNPAGGPAPTYPFSDVTQAVYFELADPEFIPDPANTTLWNYPASGSSVVSEIVTVYDSENQPHRFWKLQIAEGVVREYWFNTNTRSWLRNTTDTAPQDGFWTYEGETYFASYPGRGGTTSGPIKLAFRSLPGTALGDHHPVGAIYYDFSDLLRNYHASVNETAEQQSGYDLNRTCWVFSGDNVVSDAMGLTGDTTSSLFYVDGSAWTVNVQISLEAGAELAPGKQTSLFDFDPRITTFLTGQEDDLNALVTLKGPGNEGSSSVYDMTTVVVLPREGKSVAYTETVVEDDTSVDYERVSPASDMSLYLRGAPAILSNTTDVTPVFVYTTAEDPTAAGVTWVSAENVSDWASVTGVRIEVSEIKPQSAMNLRLDLRTDAKETIQVLNAFAGGTFVYRQSASGDFRDPKQLNLSQWVYENYTIASGRVFWDMLDENGTRNGNNNTEPYINGVTLTLYDADGNQIDQQVTANSTGGTNANDNGVFPALRTYKPDAGQYIVISTPEVTDGTVKLTKKINGSPIQSAVDSDFDRETNKLTLGTLNANGLTNISAGFVKLPKLVAIPAQTLVVGETRELDAIVNEYVTNNGYNPNNNNILINGGYRIGYAVDDAGIAALAADTSPLVRHGNSLTQVKGALGLLGVAPGTTYVTVTVQNTLGDTDTISFPVTVVPNVFYVYHSSDGTLEAVPMPDEGETVNLVDKIRTGHRYGGYYNASGAVTEENVNAAKDPALSAGRTGAAVTGAVLYTGDSLKNGSVRFWTKTDAAVAGTNDAGTELQPTRGAVYYLKEVPVKYLQSVTRYVYTVETGKLDALYFISDVDDTYYNQLYFDVQTEHGSYVCKLAGSFSFLQRGSTTITQSVKPSDFADVVRGFVASANASALLNQGITEDMFVTPYWKTLDGVDVPGVGFTMSLGDETTNPETGIQFYG